MTASSDDPSYRRLWVEVDTPHEVVATGLTTILQTKLGSLAFTTTGPDGGEPDVVFYDVVSLRHGDCSDLDQWVKQTASIVIALTTELRPDLGAMALERGAEAAVLIGVTAHDLIQVVRAAVAGNLEEVPAVQEAMDAARLGKDAALSKRETEILGLVAQGRSNSEIAATLFLSINSVKTYIRSAYRKISASNRAQAVAWALLHGFPSDVAARHDAAVETDESTTRLVV